MKNIMILLRNMEKKRNPRGYWTFDKLYAAASIYSDMRTFKEKNPDAYHAVHRKKITEKTCSHMLSSKHSPYTLEEIQEEANKYETRNDFRKNSPSVYKAAIRRDDYEQIVFHMRDSKGIAYTFEELVEIAKAYSTRGDFKKGNPTAHRAACRRDDYNKIVVHMTSSRNDWTEEDIQKKIDSCETHFEFRKRYEREYQTARKKYNYTKMAKKLKFSSRISNPEKELLKIIINFIPEAKMLRDMSFDKPNKSNIQGFEIDIFIPELNKGIEFDGKYWHSFEGLKRSRPNWSDEDLYLYHQLKDDHFLSKGIQILHIKEQDWKKDKQLCINKCLEFLGVLCP
jgi:hypothetical protein